MRAFLLAPLIGASLLLAPLPGAAQRPLPLQTGGAVLRLELAKPLFNVNVSPRPNAVTTVWDAMLLVPVHDWVSVFGQMGATFGRQGDLDWSTSTTNPRVGVALGRGGASAMSASLYADLPLGSESGGSFAADVGQHVHFADGSRYGRDTWGLGGSAGAGTEFATGTYAGVRVDAGLLLPRSDDVERETYAALSAFADAPAGQTRIWLEASGFAYLSRSELSFSRRTVFFGTFSLTLPTYRFAPEGYVRIPLDEDTSQVISFVFGARLHLGTTRSPS